MEGMSTSSTTKNYKSFGERNMPAKSDQEAEVRNVEGWPECFQDLASWCPLPQDELNTPKYLQDEFNFSNGQSRVCSWSSPPADLDSELWDAQDLLQSPALTVDEDNNLDNNCFLPSEDQQQEKGQFQNAHFPLSEELGNSDDISLKITGNLLLSQTGIGVTSGKPVKTVKTNKTSLNSCPVPQSLSLMKKTKPQLKLDISIASAAINSVPLPSVKCEYHPYLDTPEVVKSLSDSTSGFDLLSFVNGDLDEKSESPQLSSPADPVVISSDHDYAEPKIKEEPSSPTPGVSTMSFEGILQCSPPDWSVPIGKQKSRRKRVKESTSKSSKKGSKKMRLSSKQQELEPDPTSERYRELRNKNNEASRKSRLNRKQKEVEMMQLAVSLEVENDNLRKKSESLEILVKKLRDALMTLVTKK